MKPLIAEVKRKGIKKWSFRAKNLDDMYSWWYDIGTMQCSFCDYFNPDLELYPYCLCPLKDESRGTCCAEWRKAQRAVEEGNLRAFNRAAAALQKRIEALPVEREP